MSETFPQQYILGRDEIETFGYKQAVELSNLKRIRARQYVFNDENEEQAIEMSPVFAARRIIVNELHNGISKKTLTELLHSIGYNVLFGNSYENDEILESIGLTEYAKTVRAFAAVSGKKKIVFINTRRNKNGYLHSLAHELGHIVMGHLNNWRVDNPSVKEQEAEAEMFAKAMLHHANKTQLKEVSVND